MKRSIPPAMAVTPIVFNDRLAAHLKTLDRGAEALAKTTKGLAARLDEHEKSEHLAHVFVPSRSGRQ